MLNQVHRKVRRGFRRRLNRFYSTLGHHQTLSVKLVQDYREFGGARELRSVLNRRTSVSGPLLYGHGLKVTRQAPIHSTAPDLRLLELMNVSVVGSTMAVMRGDRLLHPELLVTTAVYDNKTPDLCEYSAGDRSTLLLHVFARPIHPRRIKVALHLLKEHSWNYYHWLSECLPRLVFFLQSRGKTEGVEPVTLLVDEDVIDQGLEALRYLLDSNCEIVRVRRGEMIHCDRLFYVSPFWYSLDNSRNEVNPEKDFVVDRYAVQLVREAFRPLMRQEPPTRKIYLPRKQGQVRKLVNAGEVEEVMRRNGFESVYGHEYTFQEQVLLFSSASMIVGGTGAAFSNLIFMQPRTRAIIFSPDNQRVFNYYIFQQQADVAEVNLAHLLSTPGNGKDFYVHNDFSINCSDLEALLKRQDYKEAMYPASYA